MDGLVSQYGNALLVLTVVWAAGLVLVAWLPVRAGAVRVAMPRRLLFLHLGLAGFATCGEALLGHRLGRGSWASPGADLRQLADVVQAFGSLALVLLVLNVVIFVPAGFFGGLANLEWRRTVALVFATSIGIELLQLSLLAGVASLDDVLLNALGGGLGFLAGRLVRAGSARVSGSGLGRRPVPAEVHICDPSTEV